MSEADSLRSFTAALLADLGAEVRDEGALLWLSVPAPLQAALDLPGQACVTLDPERIGQFDAELIAPGSYLLEKLLALATRRGRWDVARLAPASEDWVERASREVAGVALEGRVEVLERRESALALFAFRTALASDEKREAFHLLAATLDGSEAWSVPWPLEDAAMVPAGIPGFAPDLGPAYRAAQGALLESMRSEMDAFQRSSLAALEEEVRRIFRYFDGTVAEVREATPSGAEDAVRAIGAERDRRLAEALERFEPHAAASLCSVRVVFVPEARIAVVPGSGDRVEVRVDALTRRIRGPPGAVTGDGRAPLQARPR